ncbi:MAG TPA: hypothetical protein VF048_14045 [Gemmatimonadaceae bacterium]|jgi:hypothetical protein
MRRASLALSALAAAGALAAPAAAQRAAAPFALTLARPDAEYAEPFTAIAGVRELRDGRVIVADRTEKTIQLLDLAGGGARRIGTEGGGPNEYRLPAALFAMPGDSTLVFDLGNTRYLVLAPDGTPVRTFSTLEPSAGDMRLLMPRASDGAGNLYFLDRGLGRGPGGAPPTQAPDSGTVLRYELATRKLTPVGRVALPPMNVSASGGSNQRRVMVRMSTPFAAQDDWTVGADGRIAITRHEPYRVEWLAPTGQRVVGPDMPYRKLPVTDADRAEYRERQRSATAVGMTVRVGGPGGGGGGSVTAAPATVRPEEPTDWPDFKPPFVANSTTVGPDGRLWVLRSSPAGDDVPAYDVFDSFGKLAGTVKLPPNTRLVGFGRNAAYVVRTDSDDLQYLARYRLF